MGIKIKYHVVLAIIRFMKSGALSHVVNIFILMEKFFTFLFCSMKNFLWIRNKHKVDIVTRKLNGIFSLQYSLSLSLFPQLRHNHDVINQQGYFFRERENFLLCCVRMKFSLVFSQSRVRKVVKERSVQK